MWMVAFRQAASGSLFLLSAAQCGFMLESASLDVNEGGAVATSSSGSSSRNSSGLLPELRGEQAEWTSRLRLELDSKLAIMDDPVSLLYVSHSRAPGWAKKLAFTDCAETQLYPHPLHMGYNSEVDGPTLVDDALPSARNMWSMFCKTRD